MKLFLVLFSLAFNLNATTVTGQAFSNDKLIYVEKIDVDITENGLYKSIKTRYFNEAGVEFANISSDFGQNNYVPDVEFEDTRFNFKEKIKFDPKTKSVDVDRVKDGKVDHFKLETQSNSVVGQGFNNYIVTNFENLLSTKHQINFIVTSKKSQYKFEVKFVKIEGEKAFFKITPMSMFLKVFVDPIQLTYDKKTKRLLSFEGMSNIDDSREKSQVVKIIYSY